MLSANAVVAVIAAIVAVAGVLVQYLNARSWEVRRHLRDARLPAYAKFLQAASAYFAELQDQNDLKTRRLHREPLTGADVRSFQQAMRTHLGEVKLVGPDIVEEAAQLMNDTLYAWDEDQPVSGTGPRLSSFADFEDKYRKHRKEYEDAAKDVFIARERVRT